MSACAQESLFLAALDNFGARGVADKLGLHVNTVKRWLETGRFPPAYLGDLARMLGARGEAAPAAVDQFYTKPATARRCWKIFRAVAKRLAVDLDGYHFIEPAAGCGEFYGLMPRGKRTGIDIAPNAAAGSGRELTRGDFLLWRPPVRRVRRHAVVGNPPFGLRGHLALQFINHAAEFADLVGFVLPQLFESDGKGVPAKRVKGMALAHSERLPGDSFETPDGRALCIHTVFQVWTKVNVDKIPARGGGACKEFIRVYSLSDGGTPASTRNKAMLHKCDVYLPSTCYSGMRAYDRFERLPHRRGYGALIHKEKRRIKTLLMRHDWEKTAFPSTNSALNLRSSLIESVVIAGGFQDGS